MSFHTRIFVASGILVFKESLTQELQQALLWLKWRYGPLSEYSDKSGSTIFFPSQEPEYLYQGQYAHLALHVPAYTSQIPTFATNDIYPLLNKYINKSYKSSFTLLELQRDRSSLMVGILERLPVTMEAKDVPFLEAVLNSSQGLLLGKFLITRITEKN